MKQNTEELRKLGHMIRRWERDRIMEFYATGIAWFLSGAILGVAATTLWNMLP